MKFKIIKDNMSYDDILSISLRDKVVTYKDGDRILADKLEDVELFIYIEKEWKKII